MLAACVALLAGLLSWGMLGAVTTSVSATGIRVGSSELEENTTQSSSSSPAGDELVICFLPAKDVENVNPGDYAEANGHPMSVSWVSPIPESPDEWSDTHPEWLVPLTTVMLILAIITGIVSVLNAVYLVRIQGKIAVVSSSKFMRHLLHLPVGFYAQRMVGDLQQRQSSNESIAFSLVCQLAPVIVNTCMLVLYLVIMLNYSVLLTLLGLFTVGLNIVLARFISAKRVNISRAAMASEGKLYSTTVGGIEMMETIKAAGAEDGFFGRWAGFQAAVNDAEVRSTRLNEYLGTVPLIVGEFTNIAVMMLGIWLIVMDEFTPGALLAFTGFLSAFMAPVTQMIELGQTVQEMRTQMERM